VVWAARYEAFGASYSDVGQVGNPLRFPGQYWDGETGFYYNYQRYYDFQTGRYITSDPIGLDGGLNTYGYVGGNPIVRADPLGLHWNCSYWSGQCRWVEPNPPTSWGVGGTMMWMDVRYNSRDGYAGTTVNILPELGVSVSICWDHPQPKCEAESDPEPRPHPIYGPRRDFDLDSFFFKKLGITRSPDRTCVNIGLGIGLPVNRGQDLGPQ
jgi:RHS repeat-associated protein